MKALDTIDSYNCLLVSNNLWIYCNMFKIISSYIYM